MKLHELRSPDGARKVSRRIGRGTGSGRGKTSGRGQKGQNARSEGFRLGFEGGQMPLAQRLPKLGGFKNHFRVEFTVVNLTKLNRFPEGSSIDAQGFYESGLARNGEPIKVLGTGKLGRKLDIEAHAFSESARAAIEKRGGKVTVIGGEKPASQSKAQRMKGRNELKAAGRVQRQQAADARATAEAEAPKPEQPEAKAKAEPSAPQSVQETPADSDEE